MLSGPAAGVIGARFVARGAETPNVITLDMGGTSADIAVIREGKPLVSTRGGIGNYPLTIPMVDVQTIGAGGGSIAWLDAAGGLRVGPRSAGSVPGPACYMAGGVEPTVTDASVVLGYLDPAYFVGGDVRLDVDAAWRAVERVATPLGMTIPQAALGIHRIVNAKMADAIRLATVKRGYDTRDFSLMLFGGAGPVNGAALADQLGMTRCLVPVAPGVLSAVGLLVSDVEYDNVRTFLSPLANTDYATAARLVRELESTGRDQMIEDGYDPDACSVRWSADMRYVGQSSELEIPISVPLGPEQIETSAVEFARTYERVYGYAPSGGAMEFVNLRSVHVHSPQIDVIQRLMRPSARSTSKDARVVRECHFGDGPVQTPVLRREDLTTGFTAAGPAIIQQDDTTIVVYPRWRVRVDGVGNLIMERA
jgi:N-methylhydantoinase A